MEALLGNSFVDSQGKSFSLKDIVKPETKAVGLYFSAHWCPPCRQFTPMLAKFYKENLKNKGLEIIFVSSDKDQSSFDGYLKEMPWTALPFADRDRKNKLSSKYKVQGIPSFVILDTNGELINDQGRAAVMGDPQGLNLPWRPKTVLEIMNLGEFVTKGGAKKTFKELTQDCEAVALYFSASWCGPCKRFTPVLSECYNTLKKADEEAKRPKRFEVIFVSADHDSASFAKYYDSMPWAALDYEKSDIKDMLDERYKVEGIPSLVIIDPKTGASINESGVQTVGADPKGENFPWAPKPIEMLDASTAGNIGPTPALFVFCGSDEKAKEIQKDLIPAVDVWRGKAEPGAVCHGDVCLPTGNKLEGTEDMLFFVCGANPLVNRVRELAQADGVTVAILDLSGPFYAHADTISSLDKVNPLAIRKFVQGFLSGTVQKTAVKL